MDAKVSGDAIDVEVDEGLLAFGAEEEVAVGGVVHEGVARPNKEVAKKSE